MTYEYHRPRSFEEALQLKTATPGARWIAGGTDLIPRLKRRAPGPSALISLRAIPGMTGIDLGDAAAGEPARIGALTPLADVLAHGELGARYPVLRQAIERMANTQVRNAGTLGGNLCNASPCADTAPPLLVLEARVRVLGPEGARELPIGALFAGPGQTTLGPDEILIEILLDPPAPAARGIYLDKRRVRVDLCFASVALLVELDGGSLRRVRAAAGAVAPVPLRLREVEERLEGERATQPLISEAAEVAMAAVSPIDDVRASSAYRRHIVGVFVRRGLERLTSLEVAV